LVTSGSPSNLMNSDFYGLVSESAIYVSTLDLSLYKTFLLKITFLLLIILEQKSKFFISIANEETFLGFVI